jgi:hypothetical protein
MDDPPSPAMATDTPTTAALTEHLDLREAVPSATWRR